MVNRSTTPWMSWAGLDNRTSLAPPLFKRRTLALIVCINRRMFTLSFTVDRMTSSVCDATPTPLWPRAYESEPFSALLLFVYCIQNSDWVIRCNFVFRLCKVKSARCLALYLWLSCFCNRDCFALRECCLTPDVHSGRNFLVQEKKKMYSIFSSLNCLSIVWAWLVSVFLFVVLFFESVREMQN
jgi:hypothetical protein